MPSLYKWEDRGQAFWIYAFLSLSLWVKSLRFPITVRSGMESDEILRVKKLFRSCYIVWLRIAYEYKLYVMS